MGNIQAKSFTAVQIEPLSKETRIGLPMASGFMCSYKSRFYLVTNWHVVSGRNFETNEIMHNRGAIPGFLNLKFHIANEDSNGVANPSSYSINDIPLYKMVEDEEAKWSPEVPLWLEHPKLKQSVDVVCLDITEDITNLKIDNIIVYNIEEEIENGTSVNVMDNVFVIGFPLKSSTTPNGYPIYKGATIASEPNVKQKLPLFYIDGKTKKGMSGSAVILIERPKLENDRGVLKFYTANVYLVGVYSGRERQSKDEHEAEMGIVWNISGALLPILNKSIEQKE